MKKLIICLYLFGSLCCCASTSIRATLTDGTIIEFRDNKTRTGTEVKVEMTEDKITGFTYTSESSDANSVALKAVGLADKSLKLLSAVPK